MDEWAHHIVGIAEDFHGASTADAAPLLQRLRRALEIAPPPVLAALGPPCSGEQVRDLVAAGALIDLAYLLVGRGGLLVARLPGGAAQATVAAPGLFEEQDHLNASVPLAIGGALIAGLVTWSGAARAAPRAPAEMN